MMNTKLPWMVAAAVLLAACDEKQEPVAAQSKLPSTKRFTADRSAKPKPQPKPAPEPEPEAAAPPVVQETPPTPPPVAQATPRPAPAPAPTAEEREAQRAEQRQQRVARVTEEMTTRMKQYDANGDGLLAQSELSGPMQRGFTRADANGDGSLDAAEQQAMIQSVAERMGNFDRGNFGGRGGGRSNFGGRGGQGGNSGGGSGRRRGD